ncbi:MAG: magnesium transporter [Pseudomonadales bacterium]|nr:magnesium transporter [Pseudomonadales bacterium]
MADADALTVAFAREHPEEVAALLARASAAEVLRVVADLPGELAPGVVARLGRTSARMVLDATDSTRVADWLSGAATEDAMSLLVQLDPGRRAEVLAEVRDRRLKRNLERLLVYPERTVGAIANPSVPRLGDGVTVGDAVRLLRRDAEQTDEPVWIVDAAGRLRGVLDFARILNARSEHTTLRDCAIVVLPLRAETSLKAAADAREWLKHAILPVVDGNNYLLGALSRQRLMAEVESSRREQGLTDGIATVAAAYIRFMASALADLLSGRRPG